MTTNTTPTLSPRLRVGGDGQAARLFHPACKLCRGACCEVMAIDNVIPEKLSSHPWYKLHGTESDIGTLLPCACSKLGKDGACTIYDTRPKNCRQMEVGGLECRVLVAKLRPGIATQIFERMTANVPLDQRPPLAETT